ncbi:hypothetical protein I6E11_03110 [Bacteroides caecigallinarum]|uniref:hypothetical protein n=1 Tax=Bacteroides caecigallinarum TaxID=1411144 RepID=UPI001F1C2F8B|nr:hypothetical protein [Bacteroides caecigallinarum]MCF2592807.1 hypothetical protein [Bacteroides caecigallinarum]
MNTDTIRHLLEKFYNGETDADEEKILENYFLDSDVETEFSTDKEVFLHLSSVKKDSDFTVPEGMQRRISDNIDMWEKQSKANKPRYYTLYKYVSGIAAAVVILIGISLFMPNNQDEGAAMKDTFDNPQEAYMATENALQLFAEALNKGNAKMEKAKEVTVSVKEKIDDITNLRK